MSPMAFNELPDRGLVSAVLRQVRVRYAYAHVWNIYA